ncbi:methylenetetrahydrofolate reductase [Rurimicrobium arvi]|uniref:Methylenetetrahydrofolate reductase n=1 Tax=Rurimicrobium arvi TaxID=2049916 RepID=A0ABP8MNT2_9BACT
MKVTEHIRQASKPIISLEILPPAKGKGIDSIFKVLDSFVEFKPSFINVTYHRAEQVFKKRMDGSFERVEIRKRPGTVGICAAIMNRYNIDAVPHIICGGFSKEETENALIDLHYLGVSNVLALRGDAAANEKFFTAHPNGHRYAEELVRQVMELNQGKYQESDIIDGLKSDFCVGVAGYPEKHLEAPNLETDIYFLKRKIDLGAEYVTTQMFFDNSHYYHYVDKCRELGVDVPVIPGLKPITSKRQLSVLPSVFNVDIPLELTKEMLAAKTDEACEQIGEEWLLTQCRDLLKNKVPILHFYTLGKPHVIQNVLKKLF